MLKAASVILIIIQMAYNWIAWHSFEYFLFPKISEVLVKKSLFLGGSNHDHIMA